MGAGASRALQNQPDTYGSLKLDKKQQTNLVILSDLIAMVVGKNNLFDLSELLSTKEGCQSLLILLESKLKQEFTTLRFPDPSQPSKLSDALFLPMKEYQYQMQKSPAREALCRQFAFFIVRLTTLLSALVSSVAVQPSIATQIINNPTIVAKPTQPISEKLNLPFKIVQGNSLSPMILQMLGTGNVFYHIQNDSRPLYYFKDSLTTTPTLLIDVSAGIVYIADPPPNQTAILGISIVSNEDNMPPQVKPWSFDTPVGIFGQQYFEKPPQSQTTNIINKNNPSEILKYVYDQGIVDISGGYTDPISLEKINDGDVVFRIRQLGRDFIYSFNSFMTLVNEAKNNNKAFVENPENRQPILYNQLAILKAVVKPAVGGNLQRKSRRQNGKHRTTTRRRRYHGGAGPIFKVRLYSIMNCPADRICALPNGLFYMDHLGNTWTDADSTRFFFNERISQFIKQSSPKITLIQDKLSNVYETPDLFGKLNKINPDTYTEFKKIENLILGTDPGNQTLTSPAYYRALLLVKSTQKNKDGEYIETMFCDDAWTGQMATVVPYALLQALYYDQSPTSPIEISTTAKSELATVSASFLTHKIAKSVTGSSDSFSQLQFIPPKDITKIFCATKRNTDIPKQIVNLTTAYRTIHTLFDEHLSNVIILIRKVLSLKDMGTQQPRQIRLNPIFVTNPDGAQRALDSLIAEGRAMIASHYLKVETAYKLAIQSIEDSL